VNPKRKLEETDDVNIKLEIILEQLMATTEDLQELIRQRKEKHGGR
jgi:hypothetical protein